MKSKVLRWSALIVVLINIIYNRFAAGGSIMSEITNKYDPIFVPANYAFLIWSVIYLSFIVYLIYELLPKQLEQLRYDRIAYTMIITSALGIMWITAFVNDYIGWSLAIIILMLISSMVLFYEAYRILPAERQRGILLTPFSLYAGWLSVATIANFALFLKAQGGYGEGLSQEMWSIVMIVAAAVLGIFIGLKFLNTIFPLVIAWASVAIWSKRYTEYPEFASISMGCAIILIALSFYIVMKRNPRLKT